MSDQPDEHLDPLMSEALQMTLAERRGFIVYLHPEFLREALRDLSRELLHFVGLDPPGHRDGRRRIASLEVIESDRIPEAPGWLILPRPRALWGDGPQPPPEAGAMVRRAHRGRGPGW